MDEQAWLQRPIVLSRRVADRLYPPVPHDLIDVSLGGRAGRLHAPAGRREVRDLAARRKTCCRARAGRLVQQGESERDLAQKDILRRLYEKTHMVDRAVGAMKLGAYDYLIKPFHLDDMIATLHRGQRDTRVAHPRA
jgi:hypothetical protein